MSGALALVEHQSEALGLTSLRVRRYPISPDLGQHARTADGVGLAWWTVGEGVPLAYMPTISFSHIEPEERRQAEEGLWRATKA